MGLLVGPRRREKGVTVTVVKSSIDSRLLPHFHGHLKPSVNRSVVCSRLRPISMGTLKPPYSCSVV